MVGYGDALPTTIPGKICAALCIVVGIMVMALPISVIGTNFSQAWDARKEEELAALPPPTDEEAKELMLDNLQTVRACAVCVLPLVFFGGGMGPV